MSYAGTAASVVGGELQGWASVLDKKAMFDAYQEELARQGKYAGQAMDIFGKNVQAQGSDAAGQALATGTAGREAAYRNIESVPIGTSPTPYSTGPYAQRDEAFAQMRGQERASLGAYGDWALQKTLNDIQNKEALNQVVNFAKGTAGVFPYRMYDAQHSMDDLAMVGAAISSLGGGAANYAQYAQGPSTTQGSQFQSNSFMMNPQGSGYGDGLVPANTGYNAATDQSVYSPSYSF